MIMRTLVPVLLCLLLLVAHRGYAHETFAPLLTENTILFVHVDFSKLDVDTVRAEAMTIAENFLTALGFDARSKTATLRDLETELEKLDAMVRPIWETITEEFGIREVAVIADQNLSEQGMLAVIAFSWKGKTEQDCQKFISRLLDEVYPLLEKFDGKNGLSPRAEIEEASNEGDFIPVGDFLFIPVTNSPMHYPATPRQILTEWVNAAATCNNSPVLEVLQRLNQSDEVKSVFMLQKLLNHPAFRGEFELDDLIDNLMEEVGNFLLSAAKVEWIAVSLPVSEIYAGTVEDARRLVTIKMPSADDAKMLWELMDSAHDAWWSMFAEAMQENTEQTGFVFPPLFFEYTKGVYRTLFPDVEGDALVFRMRHLRQYMRLSFFPFVR